MWPLLFLPFSLWLKENTGDELQLFLSFSVILWKRPKPNNVQKPNNFPSMFWSPVLKVCGVISPLKMIFGHMKKETSFLGHLKKIKELISFWKLMWWLIFWCRLYHTLKGTILLSILGEYEMFVHLVAL